MRGILAASGTPETAPPVQWYRRLQATDAFVDDTAQVFLGMRLQCAKCHHHPFEKWSQDDYYGFAAFFARVGRKPDAAGAAVGPDGGGDLHGAEPARCTHPKTGQTMAPKGLGGTPLVRSRRSSTRGRSWSTGWSDPKNPFFARAVVNRYWAHFFGRGIVEPMDDMRLTNPPSNPELLDGLADDFVKQRVRPQAPGPDDLHEPDLRALERAERVQRQGQAELRPALSPADERRGLARRDRAGHGRAQRVRRPAGRHAGDRAARRERRLGVPRHVRPAQARHGLRVRAGHRREPRPEPDAPQLGRGPGQAHGAAAAAPSVLAADQRPDAAKIDELFWTAFGRSASSSETATALEYLSKHAAARKAAYEDIIWALINAKEFQFND